MSGWFRNGIKVIKKIRVFKPNQCIIVLTSYVGDDKLIQSICLLTQGKTDQEIARQLVLTDVTIRTHVSRILAKLGLGNRVQAALYAIRSGMVSLDDTENIPLDERSSV